jgi:hypothetical protein
MAQVRPEKAGAATRVQDGELAARLAFDAPERRPHESGRLIFELAEHLVEIPGEAVEHALDIGVACARRHVFPGAGGEHVLRHRVVRLDLEPRLVGGRGLLHAPQAGQQPAQALEALRLGPDGKRLAQRRDRVVEAGELPVRAGERIVVFDLVGACSMARSRTSAPCSWRFTFRSAMPRLRRASG